MAQLAERTYAQALFEVAIEKNTLNRFGEELTYLQQLFNDNPMFYDLYKTPQISSEDKKAMFEEVFKDQLSLEVMNFLKILLDKRRTGIFQGIEIEYRRLADAYNHIVEAVAITAVPLKEEEKLKLQNKITSSTGKNVRLTNEIDPSVIGGVLVRMGDKVIDGTIRSRLNELEQDLAQIIV